MPEIHILNVGQGDCMIIKHGSGHITIFDICGGNIPPQEDRALLSLSEKSAVKGNFGMCRKPTNPIRFLREQMGVDSVFRFILSHPDMDHLDGFNNLMNSVSVLNFWDSGVRKPKPDFSNCPYEEDDWDRYISVRDNNESPTVVSPAAGAIHKYFNQDDSEGGGDYISVLSPNSELVQAANQGPNSDATNDASYVIVYRSAGGRILLPGDAHNTTWDFILNNYLDNLVDCELMLAPHHGRDSSREWNFLDAIKPKFSVLGCASYEHLAYAAWNNRGLLKITQNQAGNIALYPRSDGLLDIYIENDNFVAACGKPIGNFDRYGNYYFTTVVKSS